MEMFNESVDHRKQSEKVRQAFEIALLAEEDAYEPYAHDQPIYTPREHRRHPPDLAPLIAS